MKELIDRLQRTKMILTGLVLAVVGIGMPMAQDAASDSWVAGFPLGEVGGILIGAGILGVWIDSFFQKEAAAALEVQMRQLLREHAPAMRDAVIQGFAAETEDLKRVANDGTISRLVENGLALQLGDPEFAKAVYNDLSDQAIGAVERWKNLNVDVTLTPHPKKTSYFIVTARWEYTVVPAHPDRRFVCLGDRIEYSELIESGGNVSPWYFKPDPNFQADDVEAFELMAFTINSVDQKIRRSSRKEFQQYRINIPKDIIDAGEPITISYTTKTVTPANGHLLFFDIEQPTHDLTVNLDYTDVDLAAVSAIDLVPSVRPTRIEHSTKNVPLRTLRVEIDGWTFPRSGVAFVWMLASEATKPRRRRTAGSR